MHSLASFISRRYLRFKHKHHAISFMIRISFLGITIGTFALMVTMIIMNGFEKTIHEKMQGITAHAVISSPGNKLDDASVKRYLQTMFPDKIASLAGSSIRQVLVDGKKTQSILFLKGIEPSNEARVSSLPSKVIAPRTIASPYSFEQLFTPNTLIIGTKMADHYNLVPGDSITLLVPEPASNKKVYLKKRKARIGGIFSIGLDEYDNNFAYTTLDFLRSIFDEERGVDQIALRFKPDTSSFNRLVRSFSPFAHDEHQSFISALRPHLPGMIIQSWKEMYAPLAASLKLEKYVMFFILALIVLVASMCMISVLFMQINYKLRDIAIFKTMGMPHATIRNIFMRMGLLITLSGSLTGLLLAAAAGTALQRYPFIELPDVYYVTHLPARMSLELFIIVFLCTLALGLIASWIPVLRMKSINTTQVLRQE